MVSFVINLKTHFYKNGIFTPNFHRVDFNGLQSAWKSHTVDSCLEELWTFFKWQFIYQKDTYIPTYD